MQRDSTFPIDAMDMNAGEAIAQSIPSSQSVDKTNTTTSSTLSPSNGSISGTMGMNSYALDSFEPSLFNINPLGINEPPQPPLANDLDFWLTADFDDDDGFNKDIGLAAFKPDAQFDLASLVGSSNGSHSLSTTHFTPPALANPLHPPVPINDQPLLQQQGLSHTLQQQFAQQPMTIPPGINPALIQQYIASLVSSTIVNNSGNLLHLIDDATKNMYLQQLLTFAPLSTNNVVMPNLLPLATNRSAQSLVGSSDIPTIPNLNLHVQPYMNPSFTGSSASTLPTYPFSAMPPTVITNPSAGTIVAPATTGSTTDAVSTTPTLESPISFKAGSAATSTAPTSENAKGKSAARDTADGALEEELDKRRRNTAASARFRAKKKAREQAIEQTAKQMTDRVQYMKDQLRTQDMEIRWLRHLVVNRDGAKRLSEIYEENGLHFVPETFSGNLSQVTAEQVAAAVSIVLNQPQEPSKSSHGSTVKDD